ncbi:MAG: hypothetical protein R2711_03450 [Acidimicrobiales bacterium]
MHLVGELRRFLRSRARWDGLGIGLVVAAIGAVGRWWVRNGGDPIFWNDSADYVAVGVVPGCSAPSASSAGVRS